MSTSMLIESQKRTQTLASCLAKMQSTTSDAYRCCEMLTKRARQLDSLTSPASDASSMLSRANANLTSTILLMKDAREKFDTVNDCEPAIERLHKGVINEMENRENGRTKGTFSKNRVLLTEQDVYAAADAMEILRDTYNYFIQHKSWRSVPNTLGGLERVYGMGMDAMCLLVSSHLKAAGQATRPKRNVIKREGGVAPTEETAKHTRDRLVLALQNRDLLKSIGDYEEYQPLEARPIKEIRSVFDCLGSHGYTLGPMSKREPPGLSNLFGITANKAVRTEKVGSGSYNQLANEHLKTGFPQVDAYGEARKQMAYSSIDAYHRRLKVDRKKKLEKNVTDIGYEDVDEADIAARDAVRCLEHAMIVVAGEKSVYRTVVTASLKKAEEEEEEDVEISPFYRKGCVAAYAFIAGSVVDRVLDIVETVFLKEGGIGQAASAGKGSDGDYLSVSAAGSAAAAGLRMLDGVRMLGPSLAKLCEMDVGDGSTEANSSLAAVLCIAIHRTTVKNTAKTLENLAKSIQEDPMKGPLHCPKDASISIVTKDVIRAIRLVSPYVSAYKSVSKRRALPWDPNLGDEAGELDSFVRYLVTRVLNSLKGKALSYIRDGRDDSKAKSNLFMINNVDYLLEHLGNEHNLPMMPMDAEYYRLEGTWFNDKITKIMESEKSKYLEHWEVLNTHLTVIGSNGLEYSKNDSSVLTLESGRLIKQRFSAFNEEFERTYALHKKLCVVSPSNRIQLQKDVASVFLTRYRRFYEKYTKIRFSKKHQSDYTKYNPDTIEVMLFDMYTDPEV